MWTTRGASFAVQEDWRYRAAVSSRRFESLCSLTDRMVAMVFPRAGKELGAVRFT